MAHATGKPDQHPRVYMTPDISHLSETEKNAMDYLVDAVKCCNAIYLNQANQNLETQKGVFDKTKQNNSYPEGLTADDFELYLEQYPKERQRLLSPFTVVKESGAGGFDYIPYSSLYHSEFEDIADYLELAAIATDCESFRTFLESRAEAFLTNEWRKSDIDWIYVDDSPLELTIGPYEVYDDKVFGVKRSIQGMLGVTLPDETKEAQKLQAEIPEFDAQLGKKYGYTTAPTLTPMVVMDQIITGGAQWYRNATMAFNLPNDVDIHKEVGSKQVFIRNVIHEKMERITKQIAKKVVEKKYASSVSNSAFLYFLIGHESSHGISFKFGDEGFRKFGSPLEEAKADIFGQLFLYYLSDKGILPEDLVVDAIITNMTDSLRQIRFGTDTAHGLSALMQYNWFIKEEALWVDDCTVYFNPSNFRETLRRCGDGLYSLSQTTTPSPAKLFVMKWSTRSDELEELLDRLQDIPIDIDLAFVV